MVATGVLFYVCRFYMERMWLFVYEALPQTELHDEWKALKKAKVTFVKSI